jgi:hypothetical protein
MTNTTQSPKEESQPLSEDELRRRAERLIAEGRMPSFASLLAAMEETVVEIAQEREKKADE